MVNFTFTFTCWFAFVSNIRGSFVEDIYEQHKGTEDVARPVDVFRVNVKCTLEQAKTAQRGSSTLPLTTTLDGSPPRPGLDTPGSDPGQVWTCTENIACTGIRIPDLPARS